MVYLMKSRTAIEGKERGGFSYAERYHISDKDVIQRCLHLTREPRYMFRNFCEEIRRQCSFDFRYRTSFSAVSVCHATNSSKLFIVMMGLCSLFQPSVCNSVPGGSWPLHTRHHLRDAQVIESNPSVLEGVHSANHRDLLLRLH